MKKVLLFIAMIGSLVLSSQNWPPSGTVHIVSTNPNVMCDHDSMQVNFKFLYSGNPDTIVKHFFHVWIPPFAFFYIGNFNYTDFYSMKKNLVGSDTIYSFKFYYSSTNGVTYDGQAMNYPLGQNLVCINGQLSCVNIHVFECVEPNGINKYDPDITNPVYYDLYGNIIDPRKNEIMIEKIGNKRRKIVLQ